MKLNIKIIYYAWLYKKEYSLSACFIANFLNICDENSSFNTLKCKLKRKFAKFVYDIDYFNGQKLVHYLKNCLSNWKSRFIMNMC